MAASRSKDCVSVLFVFFAVVVAVVVERLSRRSCRGSGHNHGRGHGHGHGYGRGRVSGRGRDSGGGGGGG